MERLIGIAITALPVGSVYALAASGLVLTYRTSRVFNFAHGAVGMFSAFLFREAWVEWGLPLPAAFALVVLVFAPAMAVVLDRMVFRALREAPTSVKVVVTVGLLVALQGGTQAIWGGRALFLPSIFPEGSVRVFGDVRLGFDQVAILGISLATMLALGALIRYTRFGLRVRAGVDRPDLAELSGVNTGWMSGASWALGFSTAAVAGILLSPILGLDAFVLMLFVIQAFAAALFGRLQSFPLTLAGGLLVAVAEEAAGAYLPAGCELCLAVRPAVPFALIFGFLAYAALTPRSGLGRWVRAAAAEPSAPPPSSAPSSGLAGWLPAAGVVVGLAVIAPMLSSVWLLRLERGLAMAGVFAGLVILGGMSGQISLAHTAFAGTGAFMMAWLAGVGGIPFPLALAMAALAAVPVGVLVALPAIRLHGLHVALVTFGFGLVVSRLFESSALTRGTTGMAVPRPAVASSDLAFFYVLLALGTAVVLVARNLQRSPTGRVLAAIRDSEVAARSIGVSLPLYRLAVFSLSAFMAGLAGALLGAFQGLVTFQDFHPLLSPVWLSVAVLGGLGSWWGAAVAAGLWAAGATAAGPGPQIAFGLGAMLLARNDRGLAGALGAIRSRVPALEAALEKATAAQEGEGTEPETAGGTARGS